MIYQKLAYALTQQLIDVVVIEEMLIKF